jgi:hypothetical protein
LVSHTTDRAWDEDSSFGLTEMRTNSGLVAHAHAHILSFRITLLIFLLTIFLVLARVGFSQQVLLQNVSTQTLQSWTVVAEPTVWSLPP